MKYHITHRNHHNQDDNNKYGHGFGETGTPIHDGSVKWCSCLWNTVWQFFRKLNMKLLYDSAILLLGTCPREITLKTTQNLIQNLLNTTPAFPSVLLTVDQRDKKGRGEGDPPPDDTQAQVRQVPPEAGGGVEKVGSGGPAGRRGADRGEGASGGG